jgi:hypothetical protein
MLFQRQLVYNVSLSIHWVALCTSAKSMSGHQLLSFGETLSNLVNQLYFKQGQDLTCNGPVTGRMFVTIGHRRIMDVLI